MFPARLSLDCFSLTVLKLTPHKERLFNADYIANSLHPYISMHIFQTILYTLPMVLTRRIC